MGRGVLFYSPEISENITTSLSTCRGSTFISINKQLTNKILNCNVSDFYDTKFYQLSPLFDELCNHPGLKQTNKWYTFFSFNLKDNTIRK